jgi:hypothetical protein
MLKNKLNEVDGSEHGLKAAKIASDLRTLNQRVVIKAQCAVLLVC